MNHDTSLYSVKTINADQMHEFWKSHGDTLDWHCLFTLPPWLKVWWRTFGAAFEPHICAVESPDRLLGVAPLMLKDGTAYLMGNDDVCDYLDFITAPENAAPFFERLIRHLRDAHIQEMDLHTLRPDATALTGLVPVAKKMGCTVSVTPHDESVELALPSSWDDYLGTLKSKERHEVRRKFRRLERTAPYTSRIIGDPVEVAGHLDRFFTLFRISRQDKEAFLTPRMMNFFSDMAVSMAEEGILKLFFLDLNDTDAAAAMYFDFGTTLYLYNNGFDPQHKSLSIGLLNKILSIKSGIEMGKQTYDFMKGGERYKLRLGGEKIQLYRCRIGLTPSGGK